jgi:hypothetical protein
MHVGDARLTLEREAREGLVNRFDLVLVDAFAGDAIPTHLLTREAVAAYGVQLASGGILLFHVSNRFYELRTVLQRVADALGVGHGVEAARRERGRALEGGIAVEDPSVYVAMWPHPADRGGSLVDGPRSARLAALRRERPSATPVSSPTTTRPSLRALRLFAQ